MKGGDFRMQKFLLFIVIILYNVVFYFFIRSFIEAENIYGIKL